MAFVAKRKSRASGTSECRNGAAIGGANGLLLAVMAGAAPQFALLAVAGGGALGALIALLIWSASGELPEDPVLPPDGR